MFQYKQDYDEEEVYEDEGDYYEEEDGENLRD